MEALSFQHYLENQTLISYEDSIAKVNSLCGDGPKVPLTPEDYVLGIYDMIGELMRFSITAMATNGKLPAGRPKKEFKKSSEPVEGEADDKMDVDEEPPATSKEEEPRNVLSDLREIRLQLEMFEPAKGTRFADDVEKKARVMRECVEKVEKALYSLTVRGNERPKGWRPDAQEERRPEVESY
jgi:predicted translin family RNA/ssDNA-binding protein